jgi:uncharacterized protein (PEP-CTERM system associated)
MVNMGVKILDLDFKNLLNSFFLLFCFSVQILFQSANAFEWQIRPNFSLSEIYDDNLKLAQTGKQSGFVTEFSPGLTLRGVSPWSNVNLNYRLQGLYNRYNNDTVNLLNQLNMRALLQPVQNTFFIQTSSNISQQNPSINFLATDNIAGRGTSVQNENFSIAPYLTPHFGQYATGLIKFGFTDNFFNNTSSLQNSGLVNNPITNSTTILKQGGLSSGTYFNTDSWSFNYYSSDQRNAGGSDVRFENYVGNGRVYLDRQWNVFAQTGYENNFYQTFINTTTNHNNLKNGFFYTVGVQWKPSLWYSLEAGGGNNSYATLRYNPSENLNSFVTYRYTKVGLNLGSSWNGRLSYTTALSSWNLSYQQQTTTLQEILTSQEIGLKVDPSTGLLTIPYIINLGNLVNDVIILKNGAFNFSYRLGKSTYNASFYNTRRAFQLSGEMDTVYGVSGSWNWQIIPRLTYFLQPLWQTTHTSLNNSNTIDLFGVSMGVTRGVPINLGRPLLLNSTLELRHTQQSSSQSGLSYDENRATANFFVQF